MNGTFVFVLLIIAIVMTSSVIKTWLAERNKASAGNEGAEEMMAKIDVLEERIRVLERIVTEHKVDLKHKIDSL